VDEVADVGSGVTLGKDVSGFKSIELPYLRVANVQDGHLDLSTIKTVRVRVDEVENYRLEIGDVLMTEGGDIDKLGRGTIWEGQIPECLHQNHIFRIRANRKLLEPAFYALVVESDIAKRYFNRVAKRTTNLASTNKTQVRAFRFPVPRWTPENRPVVDTAKPASGSAAPSASVLPRSIVIEQAAGGGVLAADEGDTQIWPRRRSGPSCASARCVIGEAGAQDAVRSLWRRVRQLRGPQVRTWA
jgi:type I restriction enzyme S subunit